MITITKIPGCLYYDYEVDFVVSLDYVVETQKPYSTYGVLLKRHMVAYEREHRLFLFCTIFLLEYVFVGTFEPCLGLGG